jgi:methylmalonyl-CoA mutase cobalamin-binding domain/chain
MNTDLVNAMADLEDTAVFNIIEKSLCEGASAADILTDLQEGISIVGDRFASKEYFLPDLMLSGKIFKDAQAALGSEGKSYNRDYIGTFIIGTVKGDVHDIGKNIVASVFESYGFNVVDLGVDVPAERFVQAIKDTDAESVGMSCLITTAFEGIKNTVDAIEAAGLNEGRLLLIGGGPTDQSTLAYAGGDIVCKTAQDGARAAKEFLLSLRNRHIAI